MLLIILIFKVILHQVQLTLAHFNNLDLTILDTEILMHATMSTVTMVHNVASSVIDSVYSSVQWRRKLFVFTTLIITLIIIIPITIRICNLIKERYNKA